VKFKAGKWQMGFNSAFKGLRMSGAVPTLPLYAFRTYAGDNFTSLVTRQLVKKYPAFCGDWKFVTVLTTALDWSLS